MNIEQFIVESNSSIIDVMKKIDRNAKGIVFICQNNKLVACVTDGDVRRHILSGGKLFDTIDAIANYHPVFLYEDHQNKAFEVMHDKYINAIPILNSEGRIMNIYFLRDELFKEGEAFEQLNTPLVIMAGGKGSRLKPYTDVLPKPLIPVGDKTITERIMDRFAGYGCTDVTMIVNYKKEFIKAYFKESNEKRNINFVDENEYLGTGGGLKLLSNQIKDTFFMSNCDILIYADYEKILRYHQKAHNVITLVCARKKIEIPYGTIENDVEGQVTKLKEKPILEYNVNTGFYVIEPAFLKKIPDKTFIHITDVISQCVQLKEKVGTYLIDDDSWMDMGQLDELEKMKKKLGVQV